MTALGWLIPISLLLGLGGLTAFLWSLRSGQFRDIEGGGARILLPDDPEPVVAPARRAPDPGREAGCAGTCAACRCAGE